jgi:hypothetical protein
MGKWLAKFSAYIPESRTDKADTVGEMGTMSGMSVRVIGVSAKITPSDENPPLQPGWLVVYRDRQGVLCGGCDDRQRGTVDDCQWEEKGWTVHLMDGQRLPLSIIRSVGQTDDVGRIVAAWTVREHGYDGRREG